MQVVAFAAASWIRSAALTGMLLLLLVVAARAVGAGTALHPAARTATAARAAPAVDAPGSVDDGSGDGTCSPGMVPCAVLGLAASGWACCSTPPVGSVAEGTCGHTDYGGDCDADSSGAFDTRRETPAIKDLADCVARVRKCRQGVFASFSAQHQDCRGPGTPTDAAEQTLASPRPPRSTTFAPPPPRPLRGPAAVYKLD